MSLDLESHVRGAGEPALLDLTIGEALDLAAVRWPLAEALVVAHERIRLNFAELKHQVDVVAAALLARGLRPGDRIGIWSHNNSAWTLTQLAAARVGLVLVTINPAYRQEEVRYALIKLGIAALVCADRHKGSDYPDIVERLSPDRFSRDGEVIANPDFPDLRMLIKIGGAARSGWSLFSDLLREGMVADQARVAEVSSSLHPDDAVNVQFTSGTTGAPKGATLSHRNILNNGFLVGAAIGLAPGDRLCIPVPLYHCFGMVMGNLACIAHGATMVYPAEGFDAAATLACLEQERCTHLYGVPTMFIAMLEAQACEGRDLSSLRGGIMAGAPCPAKVMHEVIHRMNMAQITIAYGMTETSPVSFQTDCDDPIDCRVGTVGRVQPHLECKIVDERGRTVLRGEAGELCTRGYSVMQGYWEDPIRTAEAIDGEGWMHSGDLATIDAEGYCRVIGRIKDMVIRGGENIYPREIEEFLFRHPGIADVAVVGVPDDRYGEDICAWIRAKPGASLTPSGVRDFCRDRIAHYKIPRLIRIVDQFPTTVTGKVQKYLIREAMIREMSGRE